MKWGAHIIGVATVAVVCVGTAWATSPEARCEAEKNREAGKYLLCRLKTEAKAIQKGTPPDFSKCDAKLDTKWTRAEQRAIAKGASCIDSVTFESIRDAATWHTDGVSSALDANPRGRLPATGRTTAWGMGSDGDVQAGRALGYVDNGDGTITDLNTGLTWEKKDDSGGIHDKDDTYWWSEGTNDLDGSVVRDFLDILNDVAGGATSCFAGACDWRLPNYKELTSILDLETFYPAVDPEFHHPATCTGCTDVTSATCSCTESAEYWTSTTYGGPSYAWSVFFGDGDVNYDFKTQSRHVRAVRGGL